MKGFFGSCAIVLSIIIITPNQEMLPAIAAFLLMVWGIDMVSKNEAEIVASREVSKFREELENR